MANIYIATMLFMGFITVFIMSVIIVWIEWLKRLVHRDVDGE